MKYIYENSKIEIHFNYPITSLKNFFAREQKTFTVYEMYYFIREAIYERKGSDETIDQNMEYLAYVDFTHFDSSAVTSMESLFEGCTSLTSVNFGNFYSSKVESMQFMFHKCENLLSIDLSRLDTSKVTTFIYMFEKCHNLIAADVSNINIKGIFSSDSRMNSFFKTYGRLKYLRIQKVQYINVQVLDSFFSGLENIDLVVWEDRNYVEPSSKVRILCCNFNITKKICESDNSIRIYFSKSVKYKNFMNKFREKINYITYNDNELIKDEINISPGAKLELHLRIYEDWRGTLRTGSFLGHPTLESFFDSNYDNNMK